MAIIAASTSTHFLLNGAKTPRVYSVYPFGSDGARLEDAEGGSQIIVSGDSTVGGSAPASQSALVDALAAIVSPAGGSVGSGGDLSYDGAPVTAARPLPVTSGALGTVTARSGSLAAAGTATIAANANRQSGYVQHTGTTGVMRVMEGGTASSTAGAKLEAGDSYVMLGKGEVTLWAEAALTYSAAESA